MRGGYTPSRISYDEARMPPILNPRSHEPAATDTTRRYERDDDDHRGDEPPPGELADLLDDLGRLVELGLVEPVADHDGDMRLRVIE